MLLPILLVLLSPAAQSQQEGRLYHVTGIGLDSGSLAAAEQAVERGLEKLQPRFPGAPNRRFRVVVHKTAASLAEDVRASMHPGAPGVALLVRQEIHLILGDIVATGSTSLQTVVEHELVHILLHQFAGPGAELLPRWFHEGMAQDLSGATYLGAREEDLVVRAQFDTLPSLGSLQGDFPRDDAFRLRQAYAQSFSFVAYLRRELGFQMLLEVSRACGDGLDFRRAFVAQTGRSAVSFEEGWIDYLKGESGAAYRVILNNCFPYLMIFAVPVLALAVIRRLARDKRVGQKLAAEEDAETQSELEDPRG